MSSVEIAQIFEPFSRTRAASAGQQRGWGIGLTLVKGVAESHGGSLKATSSEKLGTIFTLTFPNDARTVE